MTDFDPTKLKHKPSPKHTLEEVLKSLQDLIRNDLLDAKSAAGKPEPAPGATSGARESAQSGLAAVTPAPERAAPAREDFAPATPESGPVNLNAVMRSLKDLINNELDTGERPAPATEAEPETIQAPPPPIDAQHAQPIADEMAPEEYTLSELVPLDEELTLDETAEAVLAAPPTSTPTESPANMPQELIVEPEPPARADSAGPGKSTRATQQELPFDVPPSLVVEARLLPAESTPDARPANESAPDTEAIPLETASAPLPAVPVDALPTIDVEETFDNDAYFETMPESAATTAAEIQNSSVETNAARLTRESRTADAPAPEAKTILELTPEPTLDDTLAMPAVDFDSVDSRPPQPTPTPPAAGESSSPESGPAATAAASTTGTMAAAPSAPENRQKPDSEVTPVAATDTMKPAPGAGAAPDATAETASPPASTSTSSPFNLDDIPILKEVVAPPAGSTLLSQPPAATSPSPRPSPDRARDLVVRAIAKLNIEMRRSGGVGLDTKTILRLQQLIREELEKDDKK